MLLMFIPATRHEAACSLVVHYSLYHVS